MRIAALIHASVILPIQTLGELLNVLVKKAKGRPSRAKEAVPGSCDAYSLADTSPAVMPGATD